MTPNRRAILVAGLAAAAGRVAEGVAAAGDRIAKLPPLDGALVLDEDARTVAAEDFGHIVRRRPRGILRPRSNDDIAALIRWAGAAGCQVAAQGQRHSVYGRAQADDGFVIDMTSLATIHERRDDQVVVGAGATWRAVLAATLPHGLAPPVLTDYLDLSVGGTLVVGGVGGATSRHGMQTDNVTELDVVTGAGEPITCSPSRHGDLFSAVLGGLGQVGVITRATLKLIAAPQMARRYMLGYPDLRTLLADQRLLARDDRFDAVQGAIVPTASGWAFRLETVRLFSGAEAPDDATLLAGLSDRRSAATISTLPYLDYLDRLAALEKLLRASNLWSSPHPWLMTFVADSQVETVVHNELERLVPADLGQFGLVGLSALRRASITGAMQRLPDEGLIHAFNLVRIPSTDAAADAERLVVANRGIYERVRAAGGTLYPVSALRMSRQDWQTHFGLAWARLRDAKQAYDPRHVLTPGYELF